MEQVSLQEAAGVVQVSKRDGRAPEGLRITHRLQARGKFLYRNGQKFYVRGVTYGTFRPNSDGDYYPEREASVRDLSLIAASGFNAIRTYTPPPRWFLDEVEKHGLTVMVGLPWEQHIAFLDSRRRARNIRETVKEAVQSCSQHPSILCYAIGNEIPSPIVRWHGRDAISDFLETLYQEAKSVDPEGLVTYVNYPTTEFLSLPFLDLAAYNVYLETAQTLESYLSRLHNLQEEKPLLMGEVGLDSIRNGEQAQAESLAWQIRSSFASGCAGTFAFKWTDEWYRGGNEITDWGFGLTTSERVPKPALVSVSNAMENVPFDMDRNWPRISVVICTYNGSATIRDTLNALALLDYPNYEVIVVDDGSKDDTAIIAHGYDCRVISIPNGGLSNARNVGMRESTGQIVAYIDDDAYPDPHWLQYLAHAFETRDVQAVGGPNLLPPEDGVLAECISHAPGGPCHVLQTDDLAEHIPGCNMAFRKSALLAIDGFDPQFLTAGDDVDLCWRILERGWKIGFHPAAVVWHHRRPSVHRYWKQQFGYGRAEALLERKWPEKYNRLGHIPWSGNIYGRGLTKGLISGPSRVYQGTWGQAPFQAVYQKPAGTWLSLPLMPEWYLTIAFLLGLAALSLSWDALSVSIPLLVLVIAAPVAQAVRSGYSAELDGHPNLRARIWRRTVIAGLHLLQPAARLFGRLRYGLTVWRRRGAAPLHFARWREDSLWSEIWRSPSDWLLTLERALKNEGAVVFHGGDFDRWDLEIKAGFFGSARILMTTEDHANGKQLVRFRVRPKLSPTHAVAVAIPGILSVLALAQGAFVAGISLVLCTTLLLVWQLVDCSVAVTSHLRAFEEMPIKLDGVVKLDKAGPRQTTRSQPPSS